MFDEGHHRTITQLISRSTSRRTLCKAHSNAPGFNNQNAAPFVDWRLSFWLSPDVPLLSIISARTLEGTPSRQRAARSPSST